MGRRDRAGDRYDTVDRPDRSRRAAPAGSNAPGLTVPGRPASVLILVRAAPTGRAWHEDFGAASSVGSFLGSHVGGAMSDEQAALESRGVLVELLATVDLGPEIEGLEGHQLRMRMVTINPGESSVRFTTTRADRGPFTCCRGPSPTIETGSPRNTGPVLAGPRTEALFTGWRTEAQFRLWRSPSTSSGTTRTAPERARRDGLGGRPGSR